LQVDFTCTLYNLKEFRRRCREVRLLKIVDEAYNKTRNAFIGPGGSIPSSHTCTWVAHLERSHRQLTNEQRKTLSHIITALKCCLHGM